MSAARSLPFGERVEALTARLHARPRKAREAFAAPVPHEPVPRRREFRCRDCARVSRKERPACRHCGGQMGLGNWIRDYRLPPRPKPKPSIVEPPPPRRIKRKANASTAFFTGQHAAFIEALRGFLGCPQSNAQTEAEPSPVLFWPEERPGVVGGRVLPIRDRREWAEANERAGEDEDFYESPFVDRPRTFFPRRDR